MLTKKADKVFHGFGIKSVKKLVQNYNGYVLFSEKNNFFKVDIF